MRKFSPRRVEELRRDPIAQVVVLGEAHLALVAGG